MTKSNYLLPDLYCDKFNKTDRAVFYTIRQYSVKFGAEHLKHDTIVDKGKLFEELGIRAFISPSKQQYASKSVTSQLFFRHPAPINGQGII